MRHALQPEQALSALKGLRLASQGFFGGDLFHQVAKHLVSSLGAKAILISEQSEISPEVMTVAAVSGWDGYATLESVPSSGTIGGQALNVSDGAVLIKDGANNSYPNDPVAAHTKAKAAVAASVVNTAGRPVGAITAYFTDTSEELEQVGAVLELAAERIGAERERLEFDQAFEASERRFRGFAETASDWFWGMDENLRFSYFSDRFEEITGLPPSKLLGKTRQETGIPNVDEEAWNEHLYALAEHIPFKEFIHPRTKEDGSIVWLSISGKPHFDKNRTFSGYFGIGRDITEDRQRQEQLIEAREKAETANRSKSEFLANMSHEIRTPMNGVMGMAELLTRTELDEKQKTFAQTIMKSGSALLTIINDILDFSKIEAGQFTLDPEPFNLAEAIEDVAVLASSNAAEKGLELIVRIDPVLPQEFLGDAGRLRQVLTNLIGNAIKFTEKGSVYLDVAAGAARDAAGHQTLDIQVQDTGIGIPEEKLADIFGKFSQVDGSATRKYGGTGLGLAISSSLVDIMGGKLKVESALGEGARFYFSIDLPIAEGAKPKPLPPVDMTGARVLVVDDVETNRNILSENLKAWHFDSAACASADQAIKVLQAARQQNVKIDLIILDYHMPGMNGAEFAKAIRKDAFAASIPIIMLTSVDQTEDGQSFKALGIEGHLTKPVRSSQLLDIIVKVMHTHRPSADGAAVPTGTDDDEDLFQVQGREIEAAGSEDAITDAFLPAQDDETETEVDILIAEDSDVNRMLFDEILRTTGYRYKIVSNGAEAMNCFDACQPKLVLSDISMPILDGFQLTQEIRMRELGSMQRTPVVGVSAHLSASAMAQWLKMGMDDFLPKPVSRDLLLSKIKTWLDRASVANVA